MPSTIGPACYGSATGRLRFAAVEFRILGPLEVLERGRAVTLRGAREKAVLVYLLLHAGEVVPTDRLIDQLWGEEPPETARKSLQVRVAGIRKTLGADLLLTQGPGYVIRAGPDTLDLHRFERLVAEADQLEPRSAADKLREALSLWRGPPLADFAYEPFAQGPIGRLEELRVVALERRIDADLELGRPAELVGELEALVAEHPLRERLRGQLILALYRSGRQAEALDAYRATREALVEELGIDPSPALQELERAVLRQDSALDLAQPALPARSILVVPQAEAALDALLAVAQPLARQPARELILARLVSSSAELPAAAVDLNRSCEGLLARGVAARAAAFTSRAPAGDVLRLANEQAVDLLVLDAGADLLEDRLVQDVLTGSLCDVALLVGGSGAQVNGPVLVPFVGAEHDWTAVELGAWIAGAQGVPLRLAGPTEEKRDASRLLASASLAVQRALGVAAEPMLLAPGAENLVRAASEAAIVVVGLSERWRKDGLGPVRSALARESPVPTVLVLRGLRPSGLAPPESRTRFTWSLASGA
jgi:DNA-binding SARP family transcriptional activator